MPETTIVVSGTIRIDPGDRDAALALIEPLVSGSRNEPGCIEYGFWSDPTDPGHFRVFEEWRSDADLAAHNSTPHYMAFGASVGTIRVLGVELQRYEVGAKRPL